ncbi:MAG: GAF domain-containing protein [Roseiflexaceae bacterium]|nr:GAF domain-containing protein [Roseiflexaceae bacterium]
MDDADTLRSENETLRARIRELERRLADARAKPPIRCDNPSSNDDGFAAFHQTVLAIMNRLDLDDVLGAIVEHAARLAGTEHGYLHLRVSDADVMEMKFAVGRFVLNRNCKIAPGEGVSGRVWQSGESMMVANYRLWEGRIERLEMTDFGALIAVPLKVNAAVIGVLGVAYDAPDAVDFHSTAALLARFADLAAIAIDNARLYTSAQEELAERRRVRSGTPDRNAAPARPAHYYATASAGTASDRRGACGAGA